MTGTCQPGSAGLRPRCRAGPCAHPAAGVWPRTLWPEVGQSRGPDLPSIRVTFTHTHTRTHTHTFIYIHLFNQKQARQRKRKTLQAVLRLDGVPELGCEAHSRCTPCAPRLCAFLSRHGGPLAASRPGTFSPWNSSQGPQPRGGHGVNRPLPRPPPPAPVSDGKEGAGCPSSPGPSTLSELPHSADGPFPPTCY